MPKKPRKTVTKSDPVLREKLVQECRALIAINMTPQLAASMRRRA